MTGIDIGCTSQAATSIRLMDEPPPLSSSSKSISGRAIDRHNPIIRDEKRVGKPFLNITSCSNPQNPISPKPHNHPYKSIGQNGNNKTKKGGASPSSCGNKISSEQKRMKGSWGCTKPSAFISPPTSTRYLLSDKALLNVLNDFDPILTLVQKENSKANLQATTCVQRDESSSAASSSSSSSKLPLPPSSSSRSPDQVVVLRVSLHCRGCERKMRKHISRMEGVTSFNIDFAAKKLTVVGDVTPLSVLASVSKVKNATLLTPTTISSSPAQIPPPAATSNYTTEAEKYQDIIV